VRAARTEVRRALQLGGANAVRRAVEGLEFCQTLLQRRAAMAEMAQPRDDGRRDHGRRQFALARQERRAGFVALADHRGPLRRIDVVENLQQLVLDEAAFLLDHENVLQALRKRPRAGFLQRPCQRHLVDAKSQRLRLGIRDAEIGQCLPQVEIGLAGRHDAERMPSPSGGISKSVGMTILMRSGSLTIEAELSTVSEIALKPTQQPE